MKNKELTVKQQSFLDNLVSCGGDARKAADLAGYAENSHPSVVKALKTEILDMAESILAQSAPKAALKLVDIMIAQSLYRKLICVYRPHRPS